MPDQMLPREVLIACIDYDSGSGCLTWRIRSPLLFQHAAQADSWNAKFAGKPALARIEDGYMRGEMKLGGVRYRLRAHKVAFKILTGLEPLIVDHRDGDTLNNRGYNLRAADEFSNRWNSVGRQGRKLPKGVYLEKGRYTARAQVGGVRYFFGCFETVKDAEMAYLQGVAPLHGEFSRGVFA